MNNRGFSTVAVILIILLTIVSVGIYLSITLKNIKKSTAQEEAKCLGLDFKVTKCFLFPTGYQMPNSNYVTQTNEIYTIVERRYGGGDITDLRFSIKDDSGKIHVGSPINFTISGFKLLTDYSNFVEHSTVETILTSIDYTPAGIIVSPVVGESKTICEPIYSFEPCISIPST